MSFPRYPVYRQSAVEWLGEVPQHWKVLRLKHTCEVFPSNVDKHARDDEPPVRLCNYTDVYYNERITADMPFMEATASEEQIVRFTLKGGDTIVTKDSETADDIAIAAYVPKDLPGVVCGYHLSMVRPRGETCGAFVKRLFDSIYAKAKFEVTANGLTRVGLGQYALDNVELPFPPAEEQQTIADFLDRETAKIDALVEEQKRLIELLKEKRQAVISQAVTKGLDPNVPMKESEVEWLGEVPAHWQVLPCRAIVSEKTAKNDGAACSDYLSLMANVGVIPYAEKGDVGNKAPEDLSKCKLVAAGDIVINSMNYGIGSFGLSNLNGVCSPVYIVLRPIDEMVETRFALRIFAHRTFQTYAQSFGNGILAHRAAIGWDTLKSIGVPVPPLDEQRLILEHVDASTARFEALIVEAEAGVELLMERRAALISAAVTGKIDVRGLAPQPEGAGA
ncbi:MULTISPECIES: restriction endonuclease subunit S [Ramlibacter]|uniref:Restriction endonuclease subunit S n=1 Tax=Ramlibacter aquaticus TaxID=2780094 RepID=A0ABR9S9U1_9BURK|nr:MULTISPECIES: restriction endonuclease subunit S [Ramlibacter]MBE7939065.1 restriction endonuclease subunit S [Ramlibacter aquaticus]